MKYFWFLGLSVAIISVVFLYGEMGGVVVEKDKTTHTLNENEMPISIEDKLLDKSEGDKTGSDLSAMQNTKAPDELVDINMEDKKYVVTSAAIESEFPVDMGGGNSQLEKAAAIESDMPVMTESEYAMETISRMPAMESEFPVDIGGENSYQEKAAAIESDMPVMTESEFAMKPINHMPAVESETPVN